MSRPSVNAAYHPFVRAVAASLRQRCGVSAGARIIVGVSGGADSVALLRAMAVLAPRRTWRLGLAVGHVQHHLRRSAEADARFVERLAKELSLPFLRADIDPKKARGNLEANARDGRYEALVTMAGAFDAPFIAVAHHADDQLETFLMRMLRGSSLRGLSGMAWRRGLSGRRLIRPMLGVDHAAAIAFLRSIGQRWREDRTNADASRLRARLRTTVLPALRAIRPDAAKKVSSLAWHLRAVNRVLERNVSLAAARVARDGKAMVLDRIEARDMPAVVLAGLLRKVLIEQGAGADSLGKRALGPLLRAVRDTTGGRRVFGFSGGVGVTVERNVVRFGKPR